MSAQPESVAIERPVRVGRAYEQVAAILRERISSGALHEGDRLPSETALAKQAGVSRGTVREALRILQEAGLVERASPKVMVVRRRADDPARHALKYALRERRVTFHHLHEALMTIEPELTGLAAARADASDIRTLRSYLESQYRAIGEFAEWSRLDAEFHLAIANMSGNPALMIVREPITDLLVPTVHRFLSSSTQTEHAMRYHERIVDEIEERDPGLAAAVMRRHLFDFRVAWEKAGLDFDLVIADIGLAAAMTTG